MDQYPTADIFAGVPASSHEEAVRNVLQSAPADWAIINDPVTLMITCTQP